MIVVIKRVEIIPPNITLPSNSVKTFDKANTTPPITTPLKIFPNIRIPIEKGVVISPIIEIGKTRNDTPFTGPKKPFILFFNPWNFIPVNWNSKNAIIDRVSATPKLENGGFSPKTLEIFAKDMKDATPIK